MGQDILPPGVSDSLDTRQFYSLIDDEVASYGGPASLARRLNEAAANWMAHGDLDFLNNW
jgi:hypothetical protein